MVDVRHTIEMLQKAKVPPALFEACLDVTKAIEHLNHETGSFLTISYFATHSEREPPLPLLVAALNLVVNFPDSPLDAHAYLEIDDDDLYILPDEDFAHLLTTNELIHPEHGEPMMNPLSRVHLFYSVREQECQSLGK